MLMPMATLIEDLSDVGESSPGDRGLAGVYWKSVDSDDMTERNNGLSCPSFEPFDFYADLLHLAY